MRPRTGYRKPKKPYAIPARVAERAATKYAEDEHGCWISTYSTGSHGYAQVGWFAASDRGMVTAHRAAWVHHTGEQVPEGVTIDHTCYNRRCVNPKHLRDLTNFENARRKSGRDWPLGFCANGHPNAELREYSGGGGKIRLRCQICVAEYTRRYNAKRQSKPAA